MIDNVNVVKDFLHQALDFSQEQFKMRVYMVGSPTIDARPAASGLFYAPKTQKEPRKNPERTQKEPRKNHLGFFSSRGNAHALAC